MAWSNEWVTPSRETRVLMLLKQVPVPVKTIIVGDLAVHCGQEVDWCVTHVPTLTKFSKGLPSGSRDEKDLIAWCEKVQKQNLDDWKIVNKLKRDQVLDNTFLSDAELDAIERIQEMCLRTRIGEGGWR